MPHFCWIILFPLDLFGVDIIECDTDNGGCSSAASCTNTVGSFSCACLTGYTGDGFTCDGEPYYNLCILFFILDLHKVLWLLQYYCLYRSAAMPRCCQFGVKNPPFFVAVETKVDLKLPSMTSVSCWPWDTVEWCQSFGFPSNCWRPEDLQCPARRCNIFPFWIYLFAVSWNSGFSRSLFLISSSDNLTVS